MTDSGLQEEVYALLYNENKPEVAILRLNQVLRKTPENSEALALRAYSLNRLANERKQWDYSRIAIASADKALTFNLFNDIALTSKGWALIDLGRADEAVPYLVSATKANPRNEYAWYNLAWAQYLSGNSVESSTSIIKALELSPNNAIIRKGKQMMASGNVPAHLKCQATSIK